MAKYYKFKGIIYELVINPFTEKEMLDASCGCVDFEKVRNLVEPATREEFEEQEMIFHEGLSAVENKHIEEVERRSK